jgi:hypothetical protein
MVEIASKFNAAASMVGYLYQCREALLLGIEETRDFPNLFLSIERFDDVAFEKDGAAGAQLQLKHHAKPGNLTDASADLWKTLRIWSEQVAANPQLPVERRFVIITTATAGENSIAAMLRVPRAKTTDEADALKALEKTARESTNENTQDARAAFLALSPESRANLINAIQIRDNSPNITDVRSEIEDRLAFAAPLEHIPHVVDHLEGWWFAQVVLCLSAPDAPAISLLALRSKIDEIAAAYKTGQLLLNDEAAQISSADLVASDARTFVKQMRRVGLQDEVVEYAKRDYYRATAQRSAWSRENVLLDGESQRYDEELVDRWRRERLAREAGASLASDDDKCAFGRNLFHWANRTQISFRNRHEMWLCSGSYQILADVLAVGWHPDHQSLFALVQEKAA